LHFCLPLLETRIVLKLVLRLSLVLLSLALLACSEPPPPAAVTPTAAPLATASGPPRQALISSANPHATRAGVEILEAGGNAVDAAIAAHLVLSLVEPQSSGIGGGGFMLIHHAATGDIRVVDGRETAPAGARPDMFLDADGVPLPFQDRVQSGHSIGVPGAIALYHLAHQRYGALPWARLFDSAIALAEQGFEVSPRLNMQLGQISSFTRIAENADTAAYFFPDGEPLAVGRIRTNPEYAATLRGVAERGPDAFYTGPVAAAIVARAQEAPHGGTIDLEDLAQYRAVLRDPVCGAYRSFRVCTVPPPSSGVAVLAMLGLIERFTPDGAPDTAAGWGAFIDAMLLGYADRDHYVADADVVEVPTAALFDPVYLDERATARPAPGSAAAAGDPGAVLDGMPIIDRWGRDDAGAATGTTHLSVIDGDGNAVSFTASVEFAFGAQRLAGGFILNNQLTDFSAVPDINGRPVANAVAPGKRPRSSMTPTMVFDADGDLFMVTGSPGGNSILAYTVKSILGVVDFGLSAADAIALPNVVARGLPVRAEQNLIGDELLKGLTAAGYTLDTSRGENSGLHPIVVRPDGLEGAADPRREGVATLLTLPGRLPPADSR
jgi:gamma-glutamyltranspeptidase/glutathione hydrolase